MRAIAALLLTGLLVLCPILCGAEEFGHGAHRHGSWEGASQDASAPGHCPEEGDNCICQGAVVSVDIRVPDADVLGLPLLSGIPVLALHHPIGHLTWDGSPTGLAAWGDSRAVRAFLQNFRC